MDIRRIEHNSAAYEQMIDLRIHQLLEPIGVPASYIERENEKHDILIGAIEKNEMIGCCVLTPKNDALLQFRQMTVREDYRQKGIGASILEFAEKLAKKEGFTFLMMHARDPVIGFYEKSGYVISSDQFFEVGIGHHQMQKKL